jgi:predicted dehydrogenase
MADPIRIGLLGAGWITRAHGHALHTLNHVTPLARPIELQALAARNPERGAAMARDLGIERFTTDWREVVDDPEVDVVAVLLGETVHREATDAALELGKPVLCEKPLGRDRFEAAEMLAAARNAGVHAAVGFNYRYMPAMRLAREIVDSGRLGRCLQFRAVYLQDHAAGEVPSRKPNVSRAITDYAHIVDFLRYLGNEAEAVQATAAKLTATGVGVELEDAYVAAVDLRGGGIASLEASRVAWGWKGRQVVEFNGTEGSLWWDMEDLNRLHVFYPTDEADRTGGFRDVLVSQPDHPFMDMWWPPGHTVGWEHSFAHEWRDFLTAVIEDRPLPPEQASFADGYQAAVLCDAIITAAMEKRRVTIDEMTAALGPEGEATAG